MEILICSWNWQSSQRTLQRSLVPLHSQVNRRAKIYDSSKRKLSKRPKHYTSHLSRTRVELNLKCLHSMLNSLYIHAVGSWCIGIAGPIISSKRTGSLHSDWDWTTYLFWWCPAELVPFVWVPQSLGCSVQPRPTNKGRSSSSLATHIRGHTPTMRARTYTEMETESGISNPHQRIRLHVISPLKSTAVTNSG